MFQAMYRVVEFTTRVLPSIFLNNLLCSLIPISLYTKFLLSSLISNNLSASLRLYSNANSGLLLSFVLLFQPRNKMAQRLGRTALATTRQEHHQIIQT